MQKKYKYITGGIVALLIITVIVFSVNKKIAGYVYNPISKFASLIVTTLTTTNFTAISATSTNLAAENFSLGGTQLSTSTVVCMAPEVCQYQCDGTDDNVQIQTALNSGNKVIIKNGNYDIKANITIPSNRILEGFGSSTILTLASSSNVDMLENSDQVNGNVGIIIKNLNIFANGNKQTSAVNAIHFKNTQDCLIDNVIIDTPRGNGVYFEGLSTSNRNSINNVVSNSKITGVIDTGRDGVQILYGTNNRIINTYAAYNERYAFQINRSDYCEISNSVGAYNTSNGILIYMASHNNISNNIIQNNGDDGIALKDGSHFNVIDGNIVKDNDKYAILGGIASIQNTYNIYSNNQIINNGDDGLVVFYNNYARAIGNVIIGSGDQGLPVDNSTGAIVIGNYVASSTNDGIQVKNNSNNVVISGNTVMNNSQVGAGTVSGITIWTGITGTIITDNIVFDDQATKTQKYGIEMQGTSDYAIISNNDTRGNLTGDIVVKGIHTQSGINRTSTSSNFIFTNGNFSIGTTSVSNKLTIANGNLVVRNGDDTNDGIKLENSATTGILRLYTGSTEQIALAGGGKSEFNKGRLAGDRDFVIYGDNSPQDFYYSTSNGRLGLWNQTPTSTIQVGTPLDATTNYFQGDVISIVPNAVDCTTSTMGRMIFLATSTLANEKLYICGMDNAGNPTWTSALFN